MSGASQDDISIYLHFMKETFYVKGFLQNMSRSDPYNPQILQIFERNKSAKELWQVFLIFLEKIG